ncbi:MAG: hypothetical protein ACXWP5_07795, partial [Bdellovibrionota bacterium]
LILISASAHADSRKAPPARQPSSSQVVSAERSKTIDFDNELVEGMNKNPLDALTHVGKRDDRDQAHLYHKKTNFKKEMRQTVLEMGASQ